MLNKATILALSVALGFSPALGASGTAWRGAGARHATAGAQAQSTSQGSAAKQVGTIKAVSGNSITLTTDSGAEISIQVQDATRMVRVAPGQTDLKGATAIHLQDLQPGDRILVRGAAADSKSMVAAVIIAMKASDVQAKQEQQKQDWQKRGIGGLVSAVDPANGTITVTTGAGATKRNVDIHTTASTVFRRYAPDSVKFDDAKPSSVAEIKPGDQLRARGNRSADNTGFAAEEIVSGAFRNIAGTISSVDSSTNSLVVKDLISKQELTVRVSADSQVRKLPQQMAQMIAMRLKASGTGGPGGSGQQPQQRPVSESGAAGSRPGGGFNRGGGGGDLQQVLNRMPPSGLSDLQKGDAVMIVSTQGSNAGAVTAITLLAGVEPILQASPGGQMMALSPWSLGGGAQGGDEGGGGSPQ